MTLLIVGIIVFLGIHALPMNPGLRAALVGRWGETGYKVLFSLLSIAGFVLLVYGFAHAPFVPVWSPPSWTRWVAIVLMLPAFIFLVAAYVPGQIKARLKHPVPRRDQDLGAGPSDRQRRSCLDRPVRLVPGLCRLRPHHAEAASADEPHWGARNRGSAQRPDRRRPRRGALRPVPGLAASAVDRYGAAAALKIRDYRPFFALQKVLYFCHKTKN